MLLIYLGVVLATLKMRKGGTAARGFRALGGVLVPGVAAVAIVWLLSNLELKELIGMGVFLVILSSVYGLSVLMKGRKRLPIPA